MRSKSLVLSLLSAGFLFAVPAQAQITEGALEFVGELTGYKEPPRNGHDKCKGQGHGNGNGGGGHEEGECDENAQEPGPVATEACYAGTLAPESAWQRYSCTLVTYNEDYVGGTIEANESYPETLAAYVTDEAATLQTETTDYAGLALAELAEGDVFGVVEASDAFYAGITQYLPAGPLPQPGPIIDELLQYSSTTVSYISAGDAGGAVQETQRFTAGLTQYLPAGPLPQPGPIIDDYRLPEMPSTGF